MSIFRGFNFNAAEDIQQTPEPTTDGNFGMSLQALFNSDDNIDMSLINDERDIEIVVSQASVSRNLACIALTSNNGDIVNAIIELLSPASW
jgi:NACalpha-BTF3-like transcription factor